MRSSQAREHRDLEGEYHELDLANNERKVFQKVEEMTKKRYYVYHQENGKCDLVQSEILRTTMQSLMESSHPADILILEIQIISTNIIQATTSFYFKFWFHSN